MPREFGKTNLSIWQDEDWRKLPPPAQHLYLLLCTHPELSYCGVADWRPGRLVALAYGWTADDIRLIGQCLEARHFVVIDEISEEVLVRSWLRFDGLIKSPQVSVSMANAYAAVSSNTIRGVIIHELRKLQKLAPNAKGWSKQQVSDLLDLTSIDPKKRDLPPDPFGGGFAYHFAPQLGDNVGGNVGGPVDPDYPHGLPAETPKPNPTVRGSGSTPSTTATATATSATATGSTKSRGRRLPDGWMPDEKVREEMKAEYPQIDFRIEHAKFVDYWMSKPGKDAAKTDWNRVWRNWIRKAAQDQPAHIRAINNHADDDHHAWMQPGAFPDEREDYGL